QQPADSASAASSPISTGERPSRCTSSRRHRALVNHQGDGMKRSEHRILTTHAGSLTRPPELTEFAHARYQGDIDETAYQRLLAESVSEVVRRQDEVGVDVVKDGEFGKSTSWSLYALKRLKGFELRPAEPGANPFAKGAERKL